MVVVFVVAPIEPPSDFIEFFACILVSVFACFAEFGGPFFDVFAFVFVLFIFPFVVVFTPIDPPGDFIEFFACIFVSVFACVF